MEERQITFELEGKRAYGMAHLPDAAAAGVVFCHPFAEERKSAYRAMTTTARALAEAGIAALRFDYRGCGESEGEFADATVSSRLADIVQARKLLGELAGTDRVGLLGLRFGALLAAHFAEEHADVPFLVLWEPVLQGGKYFLADLRKKLIKEMMTAGKGSVSRAEIIESLKDPETLVDFDGYMVSGRMYAELEGLDLLSGLGKHQGPTLIVQISFNTKVSRTNSQLEAAYRSANVPVELAPVVEEPFWNRIDLVECPTLVAATREWLERRIADGTPRSV